MPRNSKEFTVIDNFSPSERLLAKLEADKYYAAFLNLQRRVRTGKNWERKRLNWARLERFAQFFINKSYTLKQYKIDEKKSWDETEHLDSKISRLQDDNVRLENRCDTFKTRVTSLRDQLEHYKNEEQVISKALVKEMRISAAERKRAEKLEKEVSNLRALLKSQAESKDDRELDRSKLPQQQS